MEVNNTVLTAKQKKAKYNKMYRATHKTEIAELQKKWNKNNPEKKANTNKKWYINNLEYNKQYYLNNPLIQKSKNLKYRYGITLKDYNKMFAEQEGKCWICGVHASKLKRPLHVDHLHATGKVRGLLCRQCNLTLKEANIGGFNTTSELYSKALNYITIYNN